MSDPRANWNNSNSQQTLHPSMFSCPSSTRPPFAPPPFAPPPFGIHVPPPVFGRGPPPLSNSQGFLSQLPPPAVPPAVKKDLQNSPSLSPPETAQEKVEFWMKACGLSSSRVVCLKAPHCSASINLHTVKVMLHKLNLLKLKLKSAESEPSGTDCSATHSSGCEPSGASDKRNTLEKEIHSLLEVLEDDGTKQLVRSKIAAAQKRKARRRKMKQSLWEQRQKVEEHRENRNIEVEKWLNSIQEAKRTEEMKKAADKSMADVRHKLADVVRYKELIVSWTKLRSIRLRKGQSDDSGASRVFADKMSALTKLLDDRLELYRKEEKALKVMLEMEQEETLAKEARIAAVRRQRQHERLEKGKELWLFGSQDVPAEVQAFYDYYTEAEKSHDIFLQIRREWDRYLVPEQVASATRIPRGWVTPTEPSSELWQKCLKDHEQPSSA